MTWIDNSREPIGIGFDTGVKPMQEGSVNSPNLPAISFDELIKTDSRRTGLYTGVQPSDGINERI